MRFRRQQPAQPPAEPAALLRPLLYGDLPAEGWPPPDADDALAEPWTSFRDARTALAAGDRERAVELWLAIARTPGLESRHALQAWSLLRGQGVGPTAEESTTVLGVVCEVAVGAGHDVLAAYADGSSRYLNHAGGAVVADPPKGATETAAVLAAAQPLGGLVGLWEEPSLPTVGPGDGRVLLLTPGGFRFGQGPQDALWQEPPLQPVLEAATRLMVVLTA